MSVKIRTIQSTDQPVWDQYVENHPQGTIFHLTRWKNVIEKTYGHKSYYLIAVETKVNRSQKSEIIPLLRGVDAKRTGCVPLSEVRRQRPSNQEQATSNEQSATSNEQSATSYDLNKLSAMTCFTRSHKVRMLLNLPESSEVLMKSFKSKLRSQIKKSVKEGLKAKIGNLELLDDFYKVFLINMRDLGSPVHSKKLMRNVLNEFPDKAKIVMVYKEDQPVACSMIVGFKDILENPWASALRQYSRLSPNMLLYWTMIEYASDNGYSCFDFGRSSPDEGTYKFKKQWGAKPEPLHWHYISSNSQPIDEETSEKSKFDKAIRYWQKLPVVITRIIGPPIRKHIGL